jgi:hypothetical protein
VVDGEAITESPPSMIPLPLASRISSMVTPEMPVSGPPSWTPSPFRSYQTKSPMQPWSVVRSEHGTVTPTALAVQVFRMLAVPGGRFAKLSMTTRKVTVYEPPTGSAVMGSRTTPLPSSGKGVPMPSSGIGLVTLMAFVKKVLLGT